MIVNQNNDGSFFFENCSTPTANSQFLWNFGDGTSENGVVVDHYYTQPGTYTVCLTIYWLNCVDSTCTTIVVGDTDPCDDLNAGFSSNTTPNGTFFSNATTGVGFVSTWHWDFGDGNTSNIEEPEHLFAPGTYTVCLTAISIFEQQGGGSVTCSDSTCQTLVIQGNDPCDFLQACFESTQISSNSVYFSNCTPTELGTVFTWLFGDGTTSNDIAPTHTYANAGNYEVCLVAEWQNCFDSTCTYIAVGNDPCANLNAGFSANTTPSGTVFSNGTTGTGFQSIWSWTFGDGATSDNPQPIHTYAEPGIYYTCLTVISLYQYEGQVVTCVDSICIDVIIEEPWVCDDVEACILVNDYGSGTFLFENCSTPIANSQFMWDFGDGTTDTGMIADHVYSQPGTYTVCLTMYWQNCVDSTCTTIVVEGVNPCDELSADFYYSGGEQGMNFGHPSVNLDWTYYWDFGDGTTGFGPSPYHTYPGPGTYLTCLTVSIWDPISQDSCFADHCESIVIGSGPCDFLQACYVPTQTSSNVVFFNNCTPNEPGMVFTWLFGDGSTSNDIAPTHTYANEGVYEVCLVAEWQNCFDSTCTYISVGQGNPCDDFAVELFWNQGGNDTYFFNGTANQPNVTYTWLFDDGTPDATGQNVQHVFTDPGTYWVCVVGTYYNEVAQDTCIVEDCFSLVVAGGSPCDELDSNFNYSGGASGMNFANAVINNTWTYFWDFGDGTTDYGPNPYHTYPAPGTYQTCLTVWTWDPVNQDTCFADHCEAVIVSGSGDPCENLNAEFISTTTPNGTFFSNATTGVGPQTTWYWEFGDGSTSNDAQPNHMFTAGTYTVCLTAISIFEQQGGGVVTCSDSTCHTLVIQGGDPCDFLVACFEPTQTSSNIVYFTNCTPTELGTVFTWHFGDGSISNDLAPTHTYATEGSYEVCLIAEWQNCFDSTCTYITVGQGNPCDDFSVSLAWNEGGNATYFFNATSNRPNTSFTWYFGDDTQSTGAATQHVFNDPGEYEVCVLGALYDPITGDTCLVEDCATLTVGNTMGCDSFSTWFDVVYGNAAVFFEAHTSQSVDGYVWDFGDGTEGYDSDEIHYFEPPGPYTVCLSTYYWNQNTQDTCWSTSCQTVEPFGPNGVTDLNALDLFSIYPQPATDVITIDGATPMTEAIVQLFSMDARLEHQERITALPHQLNVSQLPPAVHLMRIQLDGIRYNYRIVIQ